jgi:hypothetical protein
MSDQLHALAASHPGIKPRIHCIGGWVDPRAGLDTVEETKIYSSTGNRIPVVQPIAVAITTEPMQLLPQLPHTPSWRGAL